MPKVTIVGAGNVGATAAHIIASKNLADVVLIDVAEGLPQGKALDMMHMRSVEQFTVKVIGTNDYADTRDSDVVVITAGIARKPGMTREDLLGVNAGIMKSVIGQAMEASPNAVFICVTNPLDVMTTLAFRESGLPANRLMGMGGVLDSSRLAFAVCEQLGCAPADVTAWAVGAHGEGMVCWPRFTTVDGTPITELMDDAAVAEVVQRCVKGGAEVVAHLKTGSAYYAPGASIGQDGGGHPRRHARGHERVRAYRRPVRHRGPLHERARALGTRRRGGGRGVRPRRRGAGGAARVRGQRARRSGEPAGVSAKGAAKDWDARRASRIPILCRLSCTRHSVLCPYGVPSQSLFGPCSACPSGAEEGFGSRASCAAPIACRVLGESVRRA